MKKSGFRLRSVNKNGLSTPSLSSTFNAALYCVYSFKPPDSVNVSSDQTRVKSLWESQSPSQLWKGFPNPSILAVSVFAVSFVALGVDEPCARRFARNHLASFSILWLTAYLSTSCRKLSLHVVQRSSCVLPKYVCTMTLARPLSRFGINNVWYTRCQRHVALDHFRRFWDDL